MKQLFSLLLAALPLLAGAQTDSVAPAGDPLRGKIINVIGDSYVANHRRPAAEAWHALFAQKHGMTYNNYGRNGNCVAFMRPKGAFGPPMIERFRDMDPEADLVVIIAGHNDADVSRANPDSLRAFESVATALIDCIRLQCPKARIAWVSPWWVDRPGFAEVAAALRRVCRRQHVPLLDNCNAKCPVRVRDDAFRARYFQRQPDTAHLNAEGHKLFLPTAEAFLLRVMQ